MAWFQTLRDLMGFNSQEKCLCMIVSEQEGADIWINGRNTHLQTPRLVPIEMNKPVEISLKLIAHETHTVTINSPQNLTYYYCTLKRIPLILVNNEIHASTSF